MEDISNLEIDFQKLSKSKLRNNVGVPYLNFRKTLTPSYLRVWLSITMAYALMALTLIGATFLQHFGWMGIVLGFLLGSLAIGYGMAFLHLYLHAAAHFELLPSKFWNDLLGNIVIGLPILQSIRYYRSLHRRHHRYLGEQTDPENSYFHPLTLGFFLKLATGVAVFQVLRSRQKSGETFSEVEKWESRWVFRVGAVFHALFVVVLVNSGTWLPAIIWTLGVCSVAPVFGALRTSLEHRHQWAGKVDFMEQRHGPCTRNFQGGLLASTFGGAGFRWHALHHWDPSIAYTCLPRVEAFILDSPFGERYQQAQMSYGTIFKKLFSINTPMFRRNVCTSNFADTSP